MIQVQSEHAYRRPVMLSRQWAEAVRKGSPDRPAAPGKPRPVGDLRRLLARHRLTGAARAVFMTDDELAAFGDAPGELAQVAVNAAGGGAASELARGAACAAGSPGAQAVATPPVADASGAEQAQGEPSVADDDAAAGAARQRQGADEEEAAREVAALGLPWPMEYEEKLLEHARKLLGVEEGAGAEPATRAKKGKGRKSLAKGKGKAAPEDGVSDDEMADEASDPEVRILAAANGRRSGRRAGAGAATRCAERPVGGEGGGKPEAPMDSRHGPGQQTAAHTAEVQPEGAE
jgi:hypothetical protein